MGVLSVSRFVVGPSRTLELVSKPTISTCCQDILFITHTSVRHHQDNYGKFRVFDSPSVPNQSVPSDMVTGQFLPFII